MRSIWKWLIGIVVILILAICGVAWYFSKNWKPLVEAKLKETIQQSTDGLYQLRYDDLDLNVALGNVTLTNAELIPDSAVYQKLVALKKAPDNRFHIKLDELKIRRIGIINVLKSKELSINHIELESPYIHLMNEAHAFNDTIQDEEPKTLYDQIKNTLSAINVKKINLDNVDFRFTKMENGQKSSETKLDSVQIKIEDVLIDETSMNDSTRMFFTKMVDIAIPGFHYDLADGFYTAKFDDLKINTRDRNLLLTKVSFAPKMNKSAFFKQKNRNETMVVLKFDSVRFEHLDFKRLIDNKQTIAHKLQLKNGSASMYMDKRYPPKPGTKIGKAPHQQIMKIKSPIKIDTVVLDNIDVSYNEMSGKFHREGLITFNAVHGTMTNVTNDTTVLQKNKFMRADLTAKIMNSGNIRVMFGFDMLSKNGAHTYKGSLGAMNATAFNKILHPLLNVEIGSGNIRKITFDMQGTDYKNWGDFRFDYDNLKVSLLNPPGEEGKRKRGALSFLLNQVLINDSNPDANEKYHIGKVNYTRVPQHSFFKTLWQSLLEGIKQCAGISPEREAKLIGSAQEAQKTVKETKSAIQKTGGFLKGVFKKKDKHNKEED